MCGIMLHQPQPANVANGQKLADMFYRYEYWDIDKIICIKINYKF